MRRTKTYIVIGGLVTGLLLADGLRFHNTRSATVRLEPSGYDLTYMVAWGLGMDQKFALATQGSLLSAQSSGWLEVWDKPYNPVLTVYQSLDGKTYYLSTGWGPAYIFDTQSKELSAVCLNLYLLRLTEFGKQLKNLGYEATEAADPDAPQQWSYVDATDLGQVSANPPGSRYYANLIYLGKFGVVPGSGRGKDVGFAPADKAPEPRFGYSASCG